MPDLMRINPASGLAYLLRFTWSTGEVRLTSWSHTLTTPPPAGGQGDGETWTAVGMKVRFGEQDGSLTDAPATVDLPSGLYPLSVLGAGIAFDKVWCSISEWSPYGPETPDNVPVELWYGVVGSVRVNPSGIAGKTRVRVDGVKSMLDVLLSLPVQSDCVHGRFGDQGCGYNLALVSYAGTVTGVGVDGEARRVGVAFDGGGPGNGLADQRWRGGLIRVNGATVQVRASAGAGGAGEGLFDVVQKPDPAWVGMACVAQEGCDRTLTRCRQLNNEGRRLALGIAIPDHNPTLTTKG